MNLILKDNEIVFTLKAKSESINLLAGLSVYHVMRSTFQYSLLIKFIVAVSFLMVIFTSSSNDPPFV